MLQIVTQCGVNEVHMKDSGLECMNPNKFCCIGSKVGSGKGNNYKTNFQEMPPYYFAG
jgi:hypothetical protein